MKKVVNPCTCLVYPKKMAQSFVKISFNDGRLSISGVIGPKRNGDCSGSAGQCVDEIRQGTPTEEWSPEMLARLCDIWDRWHLNDMRPYCSHMRELGWDKLASEPVTIYNYRLTREALKKKETVEKMAIAALRKGEVFKPTAEQVFYASLSYSTKTYGHPLDEDSLRNYKPDVSSAEKKTRGWLDIEETDLGLLGKPCPVCGYKYGHGWQKEEVPQEVIDWLFSLPDTKIEPAWV